MLAPASVTPGMATCVAQFDAAFVGHDAGSAGRDAMKVLIIEDNDRLRKSLMDYLRDEGFTVDPAADGEEGLYKALNWPYDLVVLDVMLPVLDGFTVLQKLRAAGRGMPVIMLTARDGLDDRLRGLNGGADDYLSKPFEMEELVARVRAGIRRSGGTPSPVMQIGPIVINMAARTVTLDGKPVELSAREYAIIEILAMRRDEVVSRDYLYERLFDEQDETISNLLDVYIYKLRTKFGRERIVTRRGLGYQLVA
jgi:two-component system, OmpR family, response regulator